MKKYSVTERFVLHAGYSCNERCQFCYYLKDLEEGKAKDWTTEQNKKKIKQAYKWGKRAIDISGGEPTIRKDLPELIKYCKKLNYEEICIITNGIKTSNFEYCEKLKEAGLTEVLFSIHSHCEEIHDDLTRVKGSFKKIIQSVENFKKLGLRVRINTVITNENYNYVNDFLGLVSKYNPFTVNLIVFNPSETASKVDKDALIRFSDYKIIGDSISVALDSWKTKFNCINVRFLPFCFLKKHPECVRTQWQKFHEDQEWDPVLNVGFQKGFFIALGATLVGFFTQWNTPKYKSYNIQTYLNKILSAFRMKYYYKQNLQCKKCSLSPICTGVQKDYIKKFGFPEFKRFDLGKKIYNPLHFAEEKEEIFKSLRS